MIGDLDEKAAKELGLQQWNQTKGTVYRLDSITLPTITQCSGPHPKLFILLDSTSIDKKWTTT